MTIKGFVRAFALVVAFAAMTAASSLQAGSYRSGTVDIPFAFSVQGMVLPAGTYHLEQEAGKEIAILVNSKTGERVQVLRPVAMQQKGHVRLKFQAGEQGYTLKVS